ncbi:TetR/AcrR family transcriptional regulator [Micromonospora polyrhachis]|uniref:AcrR family transcriptional regulator n=1 Tax=Micromonospora polyrhachis TaxID=1282883 RepID=A0A7W7WNQ5_9ACTN|nr:TetR/AcrR family transcriptional regulator [Micromonospora polyrhachis]MBB4957814.1 AcrR family transcriptional regulator [Micromonospora polyrhachis]
MTNDDHAGDELPRSLELLWGRRERPRRGPRPGLSLEQIVQAAIELADAEGLGQVSMSRVAERVGFTTMSLYRYVEGKDELLMLMQETAGAMPQAAASSAGETAEEGWRAGLERWARDHLQTFRRHPWLLEVPISGPPVTPNGLTWMDRGLRALDGTGLADGYRLAVVQLLTGYVHGEAHFSRELHRAMGTGAYDPVRYGRLLRKVVDADRYPTLHKMTSTGFFDEIGGYEDAEDFEFGLQRVLDGIEVFIQKHGGHPG